MLPSQCWPIKTECEHGIEVSFTARNFKELCVEPKRSAFQVFVHYESGNLSKLAKMDRSLKFDFLESWDTGKNSMLHGLQTEYFLSVVVEATIFEIDNGSQFT